MPTRRRTPIRYLLLAFALLVWVMGGCSTGTPPFVHVVVPDLQAPGLTRIHAVDTGDASYHLAWLTSVHLANQQDVLAFGHVRSTPGLDNLFDSAYSTIDQYAIVGDTTLTTAPIVDCTGPFSVTADGGTMCSYRAVHQWLAATLDGGTTGNSEHLASADPLTVALTPDGHYAFTAESKPPCAVQFWAIDPATSVAHLRAEVSTGIPDQTRGLGCDATTQLRLAPDSSNVAVVINGSVGIFPFAALLQATVNAAGPITLSMSQQTQVIAANAAVLTWSTDGRSLYVVDTSGHKIRAIAVATGQISDVFAPLALTPDSTARICTLTAVSDGHHLAFTECVFHGPLTDVPTNYEYDPDQLYLYTLA